MIIDGKKLFVAFPGFSYGCKLKISKIMNLNIKTRAKKINNFKWFIVLRQPEDKSEAIIICLIQDFEYPEF